MTKLVSHLWQIHCTRENSKDYQAAGRSWWGCIEPFTRDDIDRAVHHKLFNAVAEDCVGQHQGDHDWHLRQIAWHVNELQEGRPTKPIHITSTDEVGDGAHRLVAHWHLGKATIEAELLVAGLEIFGCDSSMIPRRLNTKNPPTMEAAKKFKSEMETIGWCRVAIFQDGVEVKE